MHEICALALGTNYQSYVLSEKQSMDQGVAIIIKMFLTFHLVESIKSFGSVTLLTLKNKYPEFYCIRPKSSDAG